MKTCNVCGETKPVTDFYKGSKASRSRHSYACKECIKAARKKPSGGYRESDLWKNYRLRPADYDALLAAQGGCCAICGTTEPGGRGAWHVDHDHNCCPTSAKSCGKCVRGLLCAGCNGLLGWSGESVSTLLAAADYIALHQEVRHG